MAVVAGIAAAVGVGLGLYGANKQAKAAKSAGESEGRGYDYKSAVALLNKQIAERQAGIETSVGERTAQVRLMQGADTREGTLARYAAGNIDTSSGSANAVLGDIKGITDYDVMTIRNNAARNAWAYSNQAKNFEQQSKLDLMSAESVRKGGHAIADASLIGGATQFSNNVALYSMRAGGGSGTTTGGGLDV